MDGFSSAELAGRLLQQGIVDPRPEAIEIQLAKNAAMLQIAYKIRHGAYLSYNYITPRDDGAFDDQYDGRRNVQTVLVYKGGMPAATVRVCLFDASGRSPDADRVPAMEIFGPEIRQLTDAGLAPGAGLRAVEITRLARNGDFANDKIIIHALFRAVGYLILHYEADVVLNACRPHHMPMYRRFGFKQLEEPRQYPNLTYKAALMACVRSSFREARQALTFLRGISTDDQTYQGLICGERVLLESADGMSQLLPRTSAAGQVLAV